MKSLKAEIFSVGKPKRTKVMDFIKGVENVTEKSSKL